MQLWAAALAQRRKSRVRSDSEKIWGFDLKRRVGRPSSKLVCLSVTPEEFILSFSLTVFHLL